MIEVIEESKSLKENQNLRTQQSMYFLISHILPNFIAV